MLCLAPLDQFVSELRKGHGFSEQMRSVDLSADELSQYDAVLTLTDHSGADYRSVVEHAQLVIDTRNATCSIENHREKIVKA